MHNRVIRWGHVLGAALQGPGALPSSSFNFAAHNITQFVLGLFLLITALAVFVPLYPHFPDPSLDKSYHFAVNQALAQHLVFGTDVIFTFGPYGAIFTKLYHPATDHLILVASSFVGISYAFLLWLLAKTTTTFLRPLFCGLLLAAAPFLGSVEFFSYPLILVLVTPRMSLPRVHDKNFNLSLSIRIAVIISLATLGLLPLIKSSFAMLAWPAALCCFILFWGAGHKLLAWSSVAVPVISVIFFWLVAAQPLLGLPAFLDIIPITSGYTEAMAMDGNKLEVLLYMLASTALLFVLATDKIVQSYHKITRLFFCALFLFVAFKQGFVRHDGHALTAGFSATIAALLINISLNNWRSSAALILSLFVCIFLYGNYMADSFSQTIQHSYASAWRGLTLRSSAPNTLQKIFDQSIGKIQKEAPLPLLDGAVDIYSHQQASLFASKNIWSPRPMPQSLTAYNSLLERLNQAHIVGPSAPDNLIFRVEPIDRRLPSLEDGLSWPALLNNYFVERVQYDAIFFRKREMPYRTRIMTELQHGYYKIGEEVPLPYEQPVIFAEMKIVPNVLGKIVSFIFKLPQVNIDVHLIGGKTKNFRIISTMAESGFLISPLIENTDDFALLSGPVRFLAGKAVASVTISRPPFGFLWNSSYYMKLYKLELPNDTDVPNLVSESFVDFLPKKSSEIPTASCQGRIDVLNGGAPAQHVIASNVLSIEGWIAVVGESGIVPDDVYVGLTADDGAAVYAKSRRTQRPDVNEFFNQPSMRDVGYKAVIDISHLRGNYVLGLFRSYKGNIEHCAQFDRSAEIKSEVIGR
jgi:hypothetical protein